ncbi:MULTISPECIES: hypothetical protein [Stenotrophomonas maltophilia group]|uniref:hypothetical protein n=1 Tax=Stenotrophomonas maltophilia group TaxID=995085 RepID=UPI00163A1E7A|nr:hypothetical protein [Stenotrophomonas maltophilia]
MKLLMGASPLNVESRGCVDIRDGGVILVVCEGVSIFHLGIALSGLARIHACLHSLIVLDR